jgi:hypothetical protein
MENTKIPIVRITDLSQELTVYCISTPETPDNTRDYTRGIYTEGDEEIKDDFLNFVRYRGSRAMSGSYAPFLWLKIEILACQYAIANGYRYEVIVPPELEEMRNKL